MTVMSWFCVIACMTKLCITNISRFIVTHMPASIVTGLSRFKAIQMSRCSILEFPDCFLYYFVFFSSFSSSSSSWRSQATRSRPLMRWMTSSSPAYVCSRRVWSTGKYWQATHLLLWLCEGGIFVEHALWFGLLDHRSRLARMPASVCVHMTVQSVVSSAKPHQNDLLLSGRQVVSRLFKRPFLSEPCSIACNVSSFAVVSGFVHMEVCYVILPSKSVSFLVSPHNFQLWHRLGTKLFVVAIGDIWWSDVEYMMSF